MPRARVVPAPDRRIAAAGGTLRDRKENLDFKAHEKPRKAFDRTLFKERGLERLAFDPATATKAETALHETVADTLNIRTTDIVAVFVPKRDTVAVKNFFCVVEANIGGDTRYFRIDDMKKADSIYRAAEKLREQLKRRKEL